MPAPADAPHGHAAVVLSAGAGFGHELGARLGDVWAVLVEGLHLLASSWARRASKAQARHFENRVNLHEWTLAHLY